MTDNNHLSNKVALEILDKQIEKLIEEVNELTTAITNSQNATNKMIKEFNKKRIYLHKLQNKRTEINSMTDSYAFGIVDRKFDNTEEKRSGYENELQHINKDSKNRIIRLRGKQLNSTIKRLQNKEGNLSKLQKRLVNIKLKNQLRKVRRKSKNEVLEENINLYKERYNYVEEKSWEKYNEDKIIYPTYLSVKFISNAKYQILKEYCKMLQLKNNIVEGAIALPPHIWEKIKEKKNSSKKSSR